MLKVINAQPGDLRLVRLDGFDGRDITVPAFILEPSEGVDVVRVITVSSRWEDSSQRTKIEVEGWRELGLRGPSYYFRQAMIDAPSGLGPLLGMADERHAKAIRDEFGLSMELAATEI